MPLNREAIEALDPADPVDAATLQEVALDYYDQTANLSTDVVELQAEVEDAEQSARNAQRRLYAATAYGNPKG